MLVSRSCAVILSSASLLLSTSVHAASSGTCSAPAINNTIDADFNFGSANAGSAIDFDVSTFVTVDGSALPVGTSFVRNGPRSHQSVLLVAVSEGTTAACADLDGDGFAGLTGLVIELRDATSGDRATAVIRPAGPVDIHRRGRHRATLTLEGAGFPGVSVPGIIALGRHFSRR